MFIIVVYTYWRGIKKSHFTYFYILMISWCQAPPQNKSISSRILWMNNFRWIILVKLRGSRGWILQEIMKEVDFYHLNIVIWRKWWRGLHGKTHLTTVKCIMRYLTNTLLMGLWYPQKTDYVLVGYSDSDFYWWKLDWKISSGRHHLLSNSFVS